MDAAEKNATGALYGVYKNEDNDNGWMRCKQRGTLVGALVPDFYISDKGRSTVDREKYYIDSQSQRYSVNYQEEMRRQAYIQSLGEYFLGTKTTLKTCEFRQWAPDFLLSMR